MHILTTDTDFTDRKEKKIKEIQMGSGAKSYIYQEMRKYLAV